MGTLLETLSETRAGACEIDGETVLVSRVKWSICMRSDLIRLSELAGIERMRYVQKIQHDERHNFWLTGSKKRYPFWHAP